MNNIPTLILLFFIVSCSSTNVEPLIVGHAHNDYEHEHPLKDAIDNQFISVEADVHLMDGDLYVSHETPTELDSSKTLEALYLKPLLDRINNNRGFVYNDYKGFFYLMVDIKTEATPSYEKLKEVLRRYDAIISIVKNGEEEKDKPVKVVVTGFKGRPYDQILADEPKYVTIDGRPSELGKGIPSAIMPFISENYNKYLSYSGVGDVNEQDSLKLIELVNATHKEGKKLRLWASPDNKAVWDFLLSNRVDLINTDSLAQFRTYFTNKE